jgi:hypothetical protein
MNKGQNAHNVLGNSGFQKYAVEEWRRFTVREYGGKYNEKKSFMARIHTQKEGHEFAMRDSEEKTMAEREDWAQAAAKQIWEDCCGRRTLQWACGRVIDVVRENDILPTWAEIIRQCDTFQRHPAQMAEVKLALLAAIAPFQKAYTQYANAMVDSESTLATAMEYLRLPPAHFAALISASLLLHKAESEQEKRIAELETQAAELKAEIQRIKAVQLDRSTHTD